MPSLLPATQLRLRFARALTRMYQQEVPQYLTLTRLVDRVNTETNSQVPLADVPRHGAVRLACLEELGMASRFFNVMGMKSVSHYDLSSAGLPIHATAFRPTSPADVAAAPFRLFVSVLRPELLTPTLQPLARQLLRQRAPVFSQRTMDLVAQAEQRGGGECEGEGAGLTEAEADELIQGGCETLAWRNQVSLTRHEYDTLKADRNGDLLIDILAFRNPHLNHLTPATEAIDLVQQRMPGTTRGTEEAPGLTPKDRIEGPPARKCNVLLRQTSFLAVDEGIVFAGGAADAQGEQGSHSARFGEIEQRGAALTPKGRRRYDEVVAEATRRGLLRKRHPGEDGAEAEAEYRALFDGAFPDDWEALRAEGLIWVEYSLTDKGSSERAGDGGGGGGGGARGRITTTKAPRGLQQAVEDGLVSWRPIQYEDFLPLSAAGIFQSNLHHDSTVRVANQEAASVVESKGQLRSVLGDEAMVDEMRLYEAQQTESIAEVGRRLGLSLP